MKKLLAGIMLFVMLLIPVGSFATNWYWINSNDYASTYIDLDSVVKHSHSRDVTVKNVYADGRVRVFVGRYYDYRRTEVRSMTMYDAYGNVTSRTTGPANVELRIQPGSDDSKIWSLLYH